MLIWRCLQFITVLGRFLWKFPRTNNSLEQGQGITLTLLRNIATGLDGGKLTAATCMPLQALFLDEIINNDAELIALNSNHDDIFSSFSSDEIIKIMILAYEILGEYYEEVYISRYTDLQFRHHFRMSRPTEQLYLPLVVIALRFRVNSTILPVNCQFNFENKSLWPEKVSFCVLRSLK